MKEGIIMQDYFASLYKTTQARKLQRNRSMPLNFAREEDYDCFCAMCGGVEHFQQEYPQLYALAVNTRQQHVDHYRDSSVAKGFVDSCMVNDITYDQTGQKLTSFGTVCLTQFALRMFVTLTLYSGNNIIGCNTAFGNGHKNLTITCAVEQVNLPNHNIKAILHATWEFANSNLLNSYITESTLLTSVAEVIDHIDITDPVHKKSGPADDIGVCYARTPIAAEKIDYSYPEARTPERHQKLYLDNRGQVVLAGGYTFDRVKPNSVGVILNCEGFGGLFYNGDAPQFQAQTGGFNWTFNQYWNNYITESVIAGNRAYKFDMEAIFYVHEDNQEHLLKVSSYPISQPSPHYKQISKIHLYWGCLAEDTLVRMADGIARKIQEVRIGDQVMANTQGMPATVTNVWSGTDETLYCLRADNDAEIYATRDHPFITRNGSKPLILLNDSDELLMEDGSYSRIKYAYPLTFGKIIFNLDLSGEAHTMICNGFVVGDNYAQGVAIDYLNHIENINIPAEVIAESEKLSRNWQAAIKEVLAHEKY